MSALCGFPGGKAFIQFMTAPRMPLPQYRVEDDVLPLPTPENHHPRFDALNYISVENVTASVFCFCDYYFALLYGEICIKITWQVYCSSVYRPPPYLR